MEFRKIFVGLSVADIETGCVDATPKYLIRFGDRVPIGSHRDPTLQQTFARGRTGTRDGSANVLVGIQVLVEEPPPQGGGTVVTRGKGSVCCGGGE